MASGYDSRQAQRSSFAFASAQPVETRSTFDPGFRGGGVQGGDSVGGVVRASPMTMPAQNDELPDFLQKMVEPYIRDQQSKAAIKGATDFIAGKTLKDIADGDNGLISNIFGPSGYHQGAAAFAATAAWAQKKSEIQNNPDLEKMGPDEIGKYLSDQYQGVMTGDPLADQLLQHTIMQDHGPLVTMLTARHETYVQKQAVLGWSNTQDGQAGNLQQVMSDPAIDPNSPSGQQAAQTATQSFINNFATKPYGMTDEAFDAARVNSARAAVSKGNFYAYEAMKAAGLDNIMTDEQSARMEAAYQSGTSRAFGLVSANPEINRRLATLDMQIKTGQFKSPAELVAPVKEINSMVSRITGITGREMISGDDLLSLQKDLNAGVVSAGLRLQSRQWQKEDREDEHAWQLRKAELEQQEGLRMAATYANTGNTAVGLATGTVKAADTNKVFGDAIVNGDTGLLDKNFRGGYVNAFAASQVQSPIANAVGVGQVTEGFKASYKQWSALNAANPAAAMAYTGKYAANMEGYDRLVKSGETPLSAFAQTFSKGPDLGRVDLPEGVKRKDAVADVQDAITKDDAGWFANGRTPLSASSMSMLTEWALPKAGAYARSSGISVDAAAPKVIQAALASGEIERSGPFVWNNQKPTKKIGAYLGLPDDSMDKLFTKVASEKLVAAGFSKGAGGDNYTTLRIQGADGNPAIYIQGFNPDHSGHTDVVVTLDDLKAENRKTVTAVAQTSADDAVIDKRLKGHPVEAFVAKKLHNHFGGDVNKVGVELK